MSINRTFSLVGVLSKRAGLSKNKPVRSRAIYCASYIHNQVYSPIPWPNVAPAGECL